MVTEHHVQVLAHQKARLDGVATGDGTADLLVLVHDVLIVQNLRGGAQPAEALQVGVGCLEPRPHGAAACNAKNHVMHEVVTQKEADAVILGHGLFLQRDGAVELLDARRRGAGAALHNYLFFQVLANVAGAFGKGEVDG